MYFYVKEARKKIKTNYKYTCYFIQRSKHNMKEKPYNIFRTTTMNTVCFICFLFLFIFLFQDKINCEKAKGVWVHIPFNLTIKKK